ncbi:hypothetical protein JCM10212_005111 [Sporobolomyces blumeae]
MATTRPPPDLVDQGKEDLDAEREAPPDVIWVEWDGPSDPDNPFNWSPGRKWKVASVGYIFTCLVSLSTSAYSISIESIETELDTSKTLALLGLSTFNLAFGTAPLILAPLSEVYGRSGIMIGSTLVFALFFLPQALAPNVAAMIVVRFIFGCAGSTGVALGGGILSEVFRDEDRGIAMLIFAWCASGPTGLGPVIGGYLSSRKNGFRYVNWLLLGLSLLFTLSLFFLLDETRASVLLSRKAAKLRKDTGDDRYVSRSDFEKTSLVEVWKTNLSRPVKLAVKEPVLGAFTTWISFTWGVMYLCLVSVPLVFKQVFGFNTGEAGVVYVTQTIGSTIGVGIELYCQKLYKRNVGQRGPEALLYTAFWGGVLFPLGTFIYTFSAYPSSHWIGPSIGLTILYAGLYLVFLATYSYVAASYALYASSALAVVGFIRNIAGAVFPLFTTAMYDRLGIQGAGGLTAGIATVLSLTPFFLFRYGPTLRARSPFAKELAALTRTENEKRREVSTTSTIVLSERIEKAEDEGNV